MATITHPTNLRSYIELITADLGPQATRWAVDAAHLFAEADAIVRHVPGATDNDPHVRALRAEAEALAERVRDAGASLSVIADLYHAHHVYRSPFRP
ncbi:hypothetical protein C1Y63_04895 [Corynebacterium sp. 13CS0277]|uniref:hypothetical protein n=1 Tax=Corynebacterium sp. 13CS0277 TaxID=2071994 RepID=UPI000D037CB0|nr:hypothetical protein [Corynebacterium sp. 13CS0277]PRQ11749.1 hypothetical protein C1Y63_04895 [Corynebacterium sp. 13CS0277]